MHDAHTSGLNCFILLYFILMRSAVSMRMHSGRLCLNQMSEEKSAEKKQETTYELMEKKRKKKETNIIILN